MAVKNAVADNWSLTTRSDGRKYSRVDSTAPSAPGTPTATVSATTPVSKIDLSCAASTDANSAITEYRYSRSLTELGTYSQIGTLNLSTRTKTDENLAELTTYWYKFTAVNAFGLESALSAAASAATTSPGSVFGSPVLFNDLSGRPFAGEPGALAVNDSWASTTYSYQRRYAPTIPTLPTPTGAPARPGSSGVNPNAANEYLVVDTGGLTTALNNTTYRYVFIAKGTDLHGLGTQTLTADGASGTERWFIYWDDVTPGNITTYKPWNAAIGDRVEMPRIDGTGATYTYFVGLNWGSYNVYATSVGQYDSGCHDLIWYRCNMEGWGGGNTINWNTLASTTAHLWTANGAHDNTFFECYVHDAIPRYPASTGDYKAFNINSGDNNKFISCEAREFQGFVQIGSSSVTSGTIIEDCDIHKDWRFNSSGVMGTGGSFIYVAGEGFVSLKYVGSSSNPTRIYGNRFWGAREGSTALDPTVASGAFLAYSINTANKTSVDIRWNVFEDSTRTVFRGNPADDISTGLMSFVRNIVYNCQGTTSNPALWYSYKASEQYLNTVLDAPSGFMNFQNEVTIDLHDCMGNLYIDVAAIQNTATLGTNAKFGYNCWAGTYTSYNKTYGGDQTSTKAALNAGNFTYQRRKITTPENSTITGIVPTTSTPAAIRTMVPTSGGDQIGSRASIGVDNVY